MIEKYSPLYNQFILSKKIPINKILEIGILEGESLKRWRRIFGKEALIYGFDWGKIEDRTKEEVDSIYKNLLSNDPNLRIFIGDQSKISDINRFIELYFQNIPFDLIIDDGSHVMYDQQISFFSFTPYVRLGGVYVIEDIHTSDPNHRGSFVRGLLPDLSNSTIKLCKEFEETGKFKSIYFNGEIIEDKWKILYWDNDIVFFEKLI